MNYAYLFIDNLNGHSYENGFNELKASITALKKHIDSNDSIIVFNNEISGRNVEFFNENNIIHRYVNPSRNYKGSDKINPISILVEKIISLMNFDESEEIVLMDIDTAVTQKFPKKYWNSNQIVFDNIEYPIMQWRNLDKVLPEIPWKQFDIDFDNSFMMYNTGVIYIPKKFRKEICEKALKIVDYLNDHFEPEERCGNKLDEQIALSIVAHDCFGRFGNIKISSDYIHHYWSERQNNIKWWESNQFTTSEVSNFKKLPISVGILSWKSNETLRNTLDSYVKNGLFDIVNDVTIFFQEVSEEDRKIANDYNIPFIGVEQNIGIGAALVKLAELARTDNILLLEHDWELIENKETTFDRLRSGINLLKSEYSAVRYRHRKNPGYPLYTQQAYQGKELNNYQPIIELDSPHLMDCIHWMEDPQLQFPDKISKTGSYFTSTSRWSNFTNNPCLYEKSFYLQTVYPFKDKGQHLENDISYWWARQDFKVAWGEGLFTHNDIQKHGITQNISYLPNEKEFTEVNCEYPDNFFDEVFHNYVKVLKYFTPHSYLDIGVCKGHAIPFIIKKLPSLKKIEMIEACKDHEEDLKLLNQKTKIPYHIEVMSDSIKEVVFYSLFDPKSTQPGNSYYKENTPHYLNCVEEVRKTNTLDNMYGDNHQFDLVKLDTQGSELDILKGGDKFLENVKGLIIEETVLYDFNTNAPKDLDIKNYLEKKGFVLVDYFHDYEHTIQDSNLNWVQHRQHDAFYVKKNILNEQDNNQNSISFIFAHRSTDVWSIPLSVVNEFKRLGWKTQIYSLFDDNDNYVDDNIHELLKTRPDIIMHMDWGQHTSQILGELKKTGAYCIMESGDDPQRYDANSVKASWFDLILSPDMRCVEKYREMGYNADWWTHFSDTETYFPIQMNLDYIAVCSRGMGNGASIIDSLSQKYPDQITNKNGWNGSEHNKFLNSGEIILQQSRYGEITRRIFEGMSCKKLVLADRLDSSTKIQDIFQDGEDVVFYENETDCLNKIVYYHNNPNEAKRIAENGYNKVLNHHTQKQRVEFIINKWKSAVK